MLVLSRKVGEKIVIGNNITIVVQRVGKGRVALAIDAPQEVTVLRGELAPFGVEDAQIEFIDGEEHDHDDALPGLDTPNAKVLSRSISRVVPGNNRLREEASTRTGFPPASQALKPTGDLSINRLPHPFPTR